MDVTMRSVPLGYQVELSVRLITSIKAFYSKGREASLE